MDTFAVSSFIRQQTDAQTKSRMHKYITHTALGTIRLGVKRVPQPPPRVLKWAGLCQMQERTQ